MFVHNIYCCISVLQNESKSKGLINDINVILHFEGKMQNSSICLFIKYHLEPFCIHSLIYRKYTVISIWVLVHVSMITLW